jgi:hypothetical protein
MMELQKCAFILELGVVKNINKEPLMVLKFFRGSFQLHKLHLQCGGCKNQAS